MQVSIFRRYFKIDWKSGTNNINLLTFYKPYHKFPIIENQIASLK